MSIFIGIPCYGGVIHANFASCLMSLSRALAQHQINHTVEFLGSDSLISRARNSIVAKFYSQPEWSHLLFLDADLMFSPEAVLKMIQEEKELIGCPYPKKVYNWNKVEKCINEGRVVAEHKPLLTDINYNFLSSKEEVEVNDTCVKVKDIPTGFMLIKRSVITALMMAYPERKYKNNIAGQGEDNSKDYFYDLFGTGVVNGYYLSEDYYFCYLVRELGIDCWLETGFTLGHIGRETFYGNLALQLQEYKGDELNLDRQHINGKRKI